MRPPISVRIGVLVAAVACLGLAMCAHSEHAKPNPPANAQPQAAPQQAAPQPQQAAPQPQQAAKPEPKPEYFPATKAAGPIYPR